MTGQFKQKMEMFLLRKALPVIISVRCIYIKYKFMHLACQLTKGTCMITTPKDNIRWLFDTLSAHNLIVNSNSYHMKLRCVSDRSPRSPEVRRWSYTETPSSNGKLCKTSEVHNIYYITPDNYCNVFNITI